MNLIAPVFVMVLLTFVVGIRMYLTRSGEIKKHRLALQKFARRADALEHFRDTRAADNYHNLFELPVLFYAGVLLALSTGQGGAILATLAWLFVISRCLHSLIHLTYNRVKHRFSAFVGGMFLLIAFWGVLAWQLLVR